MPQSETPLSGEHAGKTILVVDDTSENLQVIGDCCSRTIAS